MSLQAQALREFSRQLRALASRSRLDILRALAAGESMTVTELREKVPISQPLLFVALEHFCAGLNWWRRGRTDGRCIMRSILPDFRRSPKGWTT